MDTVEIKTLDDLADSIGKAITELISGIDKIEGRLPIKFGKEIVIVEYSAYRMINFIRIDVKRIPL